MDNAQLNQSINDGYTCVMCGAIDLTTAAYTRLCAKCRRPRVEPDGSAPGKAMRLLTTYAMLGSGALLDAGPEPAEPER